MTDFQYDTRDIGAWAAFSGDFNPIHFDAARAAALGLAEVPVHGMRVMADIKAELYEQAMQAPQFDGWLLFRSAMRAPVLRGDRCTLHVTRESGILKYRLANHRTGADSMTGFLRAEPAMAERGTPRAGEPYHVFVIGRSELARSAGAWRNGFGPRASPFWLRLDGLLFSNVLSNRALLLRAAEELQVARGLTIQDVMDRTTVLQTHHAALISSEIQSFPADPARDAELHELRCETEPPIISGNLAAGIAMQVSLGAYLQDRLILKTTVTLRFAANPIHNQGDSP